MQLLWMASDALFASRDVNQKQGRRVRRPRQLSSRQQLLRQLSWQLPRTCWWPRQLRWQLLRSWSKARMQTLQQLLCSRSANHSSLSSSRRINNKWVETLPHLDQLVLHRA